MKHNNYADDWFMAGGLEEGEEMESQERSGSMASAEQGCGLMIIAAAICIFAVFIVGIAALYLR